MISDWCFVVRDENGKIKVKWNLAQEHTTDDYKKEEQEK